MVKIFEISRSSIAAIELALNNEIKTEEITGEWKFALAVPVPMVSNAVARAHLVVLTVMVSFVRA